MADIQECERDETPQADNNQTSDMSADLNPSTGAATGDSAAASVAAAESASDGATAAANTHKRKPDKAARRAASKAAKKAKRAEYVRNSVQQGAEADDAEQTEEPAADEDGRADHGTVRRQGCVSDESVRETDYYFANGQSTSASPRDTQRRCARSAAHLSAPHACVASCVWLLPPCPRAPLSLPLPSSLRSAHSLSVLVRVQHVRQAPLAGPLRHRRAQE